MMILPSICATILKTVWLAPVPEIKLVSKVPSAFKRAMFFLGVLFIDVKEPPIIIFPSAWINAVVINPVISLIVKLLSKVPSLFKREIDFWGLPLYVV